MDTWRDIAVLSDVFHDDDLGLHDGHALDPDHYGVQDCARVYAITREFGGKPVIYLFFTNRLVDGLYSCGPRQVISPNLSEQVQ